MARTCSRTAASPSSWSLGAGAASGAGGNTLKFGRRLGSALNLQVGAPVSLVVGLNQSDLKVIRLSDNQFLIRPRASQDHGCVVRPDLRGISVRNIQDNVIRIPL